MKLLALDTAMAACSAAILDTDRDVILARRWAAMDRGHAEALAPMVEAVLRESGLVPAELNRIGVTAGPGTFTGVRIGLAMARGLGLALSVPVAGLDSLSAIAANAPPDREVFVVADARKDEVYAATFEADGSRRSGPEVLSASEAANRLRGGITVLGTAADRIVALAGAENCLHPSGLDLPDAAVFARLAAALPEPNGVPQPIYLRTPDATPQNWTQQGPTEFRAAVAADAMVLAQLHAECFETAWPGTDMASLLAMPGASVLMAFDGSEPLAFLMTRKAADEAEIVTIATRARARRRGLARMLLDRQSAELLATGVTALFLEVAASNAAARGLYVSLGFTPAGHRRNYYDRGGGLREDAVVMRKQLAPR
jgi:tRNA threonylcarbamoyl adenosine modification protein YeaZ